MIRFSKILLYITIILLLFWLIPWGYGFIFSKPQKNPFILYSTVINDFAILENNGNTIPNRNSTAYCRCSTTGN